MNTYRCHFCGAPFTAWAPAQRHADTERHHRLELVIATQHPSTGEPMPKKKELKDRKHGEKRMGPPRPSLKSSEAPPPGRGGSR